MHTERLYFHDAYLQEFQARVIARARRSGQPAVALDRSAFYPEGGGQPADHGLINQVAVLDVQADDALVWHVLSAEVHEQAVECRIDWARRFDHMQQHHGQHLLSAGFEQLYGLRTVSFHLGGSAATIDLQTPALEPEQAASVEELVNRVIWEDRLIEARFVDAEELASLPLRKPATVNGPVRVVMVPGFDYSACGGTHPRSTGAVGTIHIRRWERRGELIRVEFLCGARALRDLRWKNSVLARLASRMSVAADELELSIDRLRAAEERARKDLLAVRSELLALQARELLVEAGGPVRAILSGRSLEEARGLAQAIAERGGIALLGVQAERAQLVFARGDGQNVDCNALLRATLAIYPGRGGGQAGLAQGALTVPEQLEAALDWAYAQLAPVP